MKINHRTQVTFCVMADTNMFESAGFGYTFFHKGLTQWMKHEMYDDEFSGQPQDIMLQPLIAEPGAGWNYGVCRRYKSPNQLTALQSRADHQLN